MKILFILYGFPPHGLAGACVYHFELAKLLQAKGHSIVVCSRTCNEPYFIEGIEVHPFRVKDSFAKLADAVITVPSISGTIDHANISAIQHTVLKVDRPHKKAKFIYCAEHLQGMYSGKSFVFRPTMRLTEAKKPRKLKGKPSIGFVNNAVQKGGAFIEPIAKALPDNRFEVIYFPGGKGEFFKPDLPNINYTEWQLNNFAAMDDWYSRVDIMCLPSYTEGYSTVALECLAKGIPVIARPIKGLEEPLGAAANYVYEWYEYVASITRCEATYNDYSAKVLARWNEIKHLNDINGLIEFIK